MLSSGTMMLVESSLPPSPVSITAISTPSLAKKSKAMAVVISKNEGLRSSIKFLQRHMKSTTSSCPISL